MRLHSHHPRFSLTHILLTPACVSPLAVVTNPPPTLPSPLQLSALLEQLEVQVASTMPLMPPAAPGGISLAPSFAAPSIVDDHSVREALADGTNYRCPGPHLHNTVC